MTPFGLDVLDHTPAFLMYSLTYIMQVPIFFSMIPNLIPLLHSQKRHRRAGKQDSNDEEHEYRICLRHHAPSIQPILSIYGPVITPSLTLYILTTAIEEMVLRQVAGPVLFALVATVGTPNLNSK